jgi:hypothetical protein
MTSEDTLSKKKFGQIRGLFHPKKCEDNPTKKWRFPAGNPDFAAKNKHLFQTAELDKKQDFCEEKIEVCLNREDSTIINIPSFSKQLSLQWN